MTQVQDTIVFFPHYFFYICNKVILCRTSFFLYLRHSLVNGVSTNVKLQASRGSTNVKLQASR